jgi:GTP cyclohydrolase II
MATTAEPRTFATIEEALEDFRAGNVTEQVPIDVPPNAQNLRYLQTKRAKLGHCVHHQDLKFEPDEQ